MNTLEEEPKDLPFYDRLRNRSANLVRSNCFEYATGLVILLRPGTMTLYVWNRLFLYFILYFELSFWGVFDHCGRMRLCLEFSHRFAPLRIHPDAF